MISGTSTFSIVRFLHRTVEPDFRVPEELVGTDEHRSAFQDIAKARWFIRRHLSEELSSQYRDIDEPRILWDTIKEHCRQREILTAPEALETWQNLRLDSFESVSTYNSALCSIVRRLKFCGQSDAVTDKNQIWKTLATVPAPVLDILHEDMPFGSYDDLLASLLKWESANRLAGQQADSEILISPTVTLVQPTVQMRPPVATGRRTGRRGNAGPSESHQTDGVARGQRQPPSPQGADRALSAVQFAAPETQLQYCSSSDRCLST